MFRKTLWLPLTVNWIARDQENQAPSSCQSPPKGRGPQFLKRNVKILFPPSLCIIKSKLWELSSQELWACLACYRRSFVAGRFTCLRPSARGSQTLDLELYWPNKKHSQVFGCIRNSLVLSFFLCFLWVEGSFWLKILPTFTSFEQGKMHALLANVIHMSETEMKIQQQLHKYLEQIIGKCMIIF